MTDYASLKVQELKALLKDRSLSQTGRKLDLISRLEEADSKANGQNEERDAVRSADDADAKPVDVEPHKVKNGDVDVPQDIAPAAANEEHSAEPESAPPGSGETAQGNDGKDADGAVQEAARTEPQADTAGTDAGTPKAADPVLEQPVADDHVLQEAHHKTGVPSTPENVQPEVPSSHEAEKLEMQNKDDGATAPSGKDAETAAGASASQDHAAHQPEESDSLGLDDTDSDQQDAKGDASAAAESGPAETNPAPGAEVEHKGQGDPPLKSAEKRTADTPAVHSSRTSHKQGDVQEQAAPPPQAKRKHAAIVFPDSATHADRPAPAKREKVELVVPEATDETRALCISGLKRPLREMDLKEILSKTGTIEGFWIDSCKTHCYVVYGTVEEAKATRDATDGLLWPPRCRSVMRPKFVSVEEAQGMIDSKGAATLTRVPSTPAPGAAEAKSGEAVSKQNSTIEANTATEPASTAAEPVIDLTTRSAAPRAPRRDASQIAAGGSAPPELAPSELFKLTDAAPPLYWLPLTDEQVAHRRSVDAARRARAAAAAAAAANTDEQDIPGTHNGGQEDAEKGDDVGGGGVSGTAVDAAPKGAAQVDVEMVGEDDGKQSRDD